MDERKDIIEDMMLTVIVPCHNETEDELNRSLGSVSGLEIEGYEVLVIDNNSEAHTADFLKAYCKARKEFRYILETSQGVAAARNKGIAESHGKYVVFLDADDYMFGESLEHILKENIEMMQSKNVDQFLFDQKGNEQDIQWFSDCQGGYVAWKEVAEKAFTAPTPGFSTAIYRRAFLKENGISFPYGVRIGEDHFFSFTFWKAKPIIYYIPAYLNYFDFEVSSRANRYVSDPSGSLEDLLFERQFKEEFVRNADFSPSKSAEILRLLDKRCMDGLFSELLYLTEGRVAADEIREKVREIYWRFDIGEMTDKKSRIEYAIVMRKLWFLLPFICKVRMVRQRMRRVRR